MYNLFSLVDIIFKGNQQPPASVFISQCNNQVCGYSANNQGEPNTHIISKIESFICHPEKYTVSRHRRVELNSLHAFNAGLIWCDMIGPLGYASRAPLAGSGTTEPKQPVSPAASVRGTFSIRK